MGMKTRDLKKERKSCLATHLEETHVRKSLDSAVVFSNDYRWLCSVRTDRYEDLNVQNYRQA